MSPAKPLVSYLLLLVDVGKEHGIAKELRKLPSVTEAQVVHGGFDVVARIELGDVTLMDVTITMARKLPSVTRTSTLISSGIQNWQTMVWRLVVWDGGIANLVDSHMCVV
jgi:hypothetical protein